MGFRSITCCVDQRGGRWSLCKHTRLRPRLYAGTLPQAPGYHWRLPLNTMLLPALSMGASQHRGLCFRVSLWLRITAKTETDRTKHWLWTDDDDTCLYICVFEVIAVAVVVQSNSLCKIRLLLRIKIPECHNNVTREVLCLCSVKRSSDEHWAGIAAKKRHVHGTAMAWNQHIWL